MNPRAIPSTSHVLLALCAVCGPPGSLLAQPARVAAPMDPYSYPLRPSQILRSSDVPFAETPETRRFGFDVPFPNVQRKVFAVEDYGAQADGKTDCTPAFYKALAAANACGQAAEIVFTERGRYRFAPSLELGSDDLAILNVRDARDLLIRGQGHDTVLVMADPALGGLSITDSDTVMVRDLGIDYNPLPFTQGKVVSVDEAGGCFVLRLDEGYPTPAAVREAIPGYHGGYRVAVAGEGAYKWPPITPLMINGVQQVEGPDWRFEADPAALRGYLSVNDEFIYVGRRLAQMALGASETRGFHVQNVAVHASPTCGLGLRNADGVSIDGYADTIPAGSGRLLSSNADGIFVHGARGGITVRNSYFMGQGDDCINLHCPAFSGRYVALHSETEVAIAAPVDVRGGDRLEVMDPTVGLIKGQVKVLSAAWGADRQSIRCVLERPLSAVGYSSETDYIYPVDLSASNFKIVHNYFGQNRSRCMLIQARDGLIAANTSEDAEGYGICMGYGGTAWAEGIIPSRVTVQGNVFRNVTGVGLAGAIELGDGSQYRNFRDIVIVDNQFFNMRKMAVTAAGCVGLRITGNTVSTDAGRRNTWNHPEWYPVDCSIYLRNCTGVVVDRLGLRDPTSRRWASTSTKAATPGPRGSRSAGSRPSCRRASAWSRTCADAAGRTPSRIAALVVWCALSPGTSL